MAVNPHIKEVISNFCFGITSFCCLTEYLKTGNADNEKQNASCVCV